MENVKTRDRSVLAALALAAIFAALLPSCGLKKKIDAAKSAAETLTKIAETGLDAAKDAAAAEGSGANGAESPLTPELLLQKYPSGLTYVETVGSGSATITNEYALAKDRAALRTKHEGGSFRVIIDGAKLTIIDEGAKSGFAQNVSSFHDALSLANVLTGNVFVDPGAILSDGEGVKKTGSETVNGQACSVYEAGYALLLANATYKLWKSEALGVVVRGRLAAKGEGAGNESYSYDLTGIKPGAPAAELFAVPAGVSVVDPAAAIQ
jgi:hypothetical protein